MKLFSRTTRTTAPHRSQPASGADARYRAQAQAAQHAQATRNRQVFVPFLLALCLIACVAAYVVWMRYAPRSWSLPPLLNPPITEHNWHLSHFVMDPMTSPMDPALASHLWLRVLPSDLPATLIPTLLPSPGEADMLTQYQRRSALHSEQVISFTMPLHMQSAVQGSYEQALFASGFTRIATPASTHADRPSWWMRRDMDADLSQQILMMQFTPEPPRTHVWVYFIQRSGHRP